LHGDFLRKMMVAGKVGGIRLQIPDLSINYLKMNKFIF